MFFASAESDDLDFSLYPDRDHQLFFLKTYLSARNRFQNQTADVTDQELETLYKQVNKMALVSCYARHRCGSRVESSEINNWIFPPFLTLVQWFGHIAQVQWFNVQFDHESRQDYWFVIVTS